MQTGGMTEEPKMNFNINSKLQREAGNSSFGQVWLMLIEDGTVHPLLYAAFPAMFCL